MRMVYACSSAIFGDAVGALDENSIPDPITPYGLSKLTGEKLVEQYCEHYSLAGFSLRFSNAYGPGLPRTQNVVQKYIAAALGQHAFTVHGDGTHTRDFIHVDDIAGAIVSALTVPAAGFHTLQVSSGVETSINTLIEKLSSAARDLGIEPPDIVHGEPREGDIYKSASDNRKAMRALGWAPRVAIEDGLRATMQWHADHAR